MSVINTNISATIATNAMARNERQMSTAMERLSTGLRINSAKDDAAGLAISSRMKAVVSGLTMASKNANDAISMLEVAEGATLEISNMLIRMRELAVQSASGTYSDSDRDALDLEFGALMSGADAQTTATLTRFGEHIGVAFQLADDLVDITSDSAQSGKTPGTDQREGVPTLAALMAMRANDDPLLVDALSRPLHDEVEHGRALSALRAHPALIEAQNEARRWADSARSCLDGLSDDPATEALRALCDYVVNRTG